MLGGPRKGGHGRKTEVIHQGKRAKIHLYLVSRDAVSSQDYSVIPTVLFLRDVKEGIKTYEAL